MKKYPLFLSPVIRSAIWGGNSLVDRWGMKACADNAAEAWMLSVRKNEMSKITNGEAEGMTLDEYFDQVGYDSIRPDFVKDDTFPLLTKFIDARADLSVQVHPDDAYAKRVENDLGKTEMWYVVEASQGAEIVYGIAEGVDGTEFQKAVDTGELGHVMNRVKVKAGDCYFIPSGMLHAIGGGILIAEIQQNSNTTYRVYDHGRVGADGKPRELHVDKALDVTATEPPKAAYGQPESINMTGMWKTPLAECSYFSTEKYDIFRSLTVGSADTFCHILVLEGEADIVYVGENIIHVKKGSSVFVPAGADMCEIKGKCSIILTKEN